MSSTLRPPCSASSSTRRWWAKLGLHGVPPLAHAQLFVGKEGSSASMFRRSLSSAVVGAPYGAELGVLRSAPMSLTVGDECRGHRRKLGLRAWAALCSVLAGREEFDVSHMLGLREVERELGFTHGGARPPWAVALLLGYSRY
ncbi:hypothetical protein Dimus_027062 [Dionaea muscipula]